MEEVLEGHQIFEFELLGWVIYVFLVIVFFGDDGFLESLDSYCCEQLSIYIIGKIYEIFVYCDCDLKEIFSFNYN
jgi:hypothetical protein